MKRLPYWAIAGCSAAIIYFVAYSNGRDSVEDSARDHQTASALHAANQWKVKYASLAHDAEVFRTVANRERATATIDSMAAAELLTQLVRITDSLPAMLTARDSIPVYQSMQRTSEQLAARLSSEVDRVKRQAEAIGMERDRWKDLATQAKPLIDSLGAALVAEHEARSCKILFVKCPSRKTSALLGAAATVVVLSLPH